MIDPVALSKIKHLIPAGEKVLWAGKPGHKLFSVYNIFLLILSALFLLVFYFLSAANEQSIIFYLAVIFGAIGVLWTLRKTKHDCFAVTDQALYVMRMGVFDWREGRLPHSKILAVRSFFGMKSVSSIVYAPLDNIGFASKYIWDAYWYIGFWVRHAIHIRDVPDMEGLMLLLQQQGKTT